jgi:two-component system, OmpR family, phosphate regulon sensor histidine kinase PhoR
VESDVPAPPLPDERDTAQTAQRRTRLALGAMLILLVALAGIAAFATDKLYRTSENRYIKEAFPLRGESRDLILEMLNEETGVRGYLISAEPASLQPYRQARPIVASDLAGLTTLTGRRPEIAGTVVELRRLVTDLETFYEAQIRLVASGPAGQRRAQRGLLDGKARFDRFRAVSGSLFDRSQQIVRSAERSQHRTFVSTLVLVLTTGGAATAIGLVLLFLLPKRMGLLYRREQDARRSAERGDRASRALEHVVDAVVLLDTQDVVRYWNPAAAATFDVSEHDALGRPARELIPGLDALEQAHARGGEGAVVALERDGAERSFGVRETRFPEGRVLVLRDVTAEQQLDRARSEFLATASHELRTPLTAVYGAVRTLRRFDRDEEPELTERLLTIIEQESERLAAIVEQILVSAQLDRHALHLERQECNLTELCESVIASAELRHGSHVLALDAPESVVVECDPARLRQVLVNLLDNALKYSASGSRVELRVHEDGGSVAVDVTDEGIGIPADAQARVFEKFYRADPDMLSGVGGSGLGLYISRELIEQMGGTIGVRSRPGQGSTFTIRLPL